MTSLFELDIRKTKEYKFYRLSLHLNSPHCYYRIVDSEDSDEEKPKPKGKQKKSIDEDVKEVTKNIKNVSISNKSQKKKVGDSEGNTIFAMKYKYAF